MELLGKIVQQSSCTFDVLSASSQIMYSSFHWWIVHQTSCTVDVFSASSQSHGQLFSLMDCTHNILYSWCIAIFIAVHVQFCKWWIVPQSLCTDDVLSASSQIMYSSVHWWVIHQTSCTADVLPVYCVSCTASLITNHQV